MLYLGKRILYLSMTEEVTQYTGRVHLTRGIRGHREILQNVSGIPGETNED